MSIHCRIVDRPIDVDSLEEVVSGPENGAVVTFLGQGRNNSRGREVAWVEYDADVPMDEKQMASIATDAEAKWGVAIALEHRIGRIELSESSVAICVGSPHRAAAFEACRYVIDTLKETVPIWKKEVCPDGAFWIEGEEA